MTHERGVNDYIGLLAADIATTTALSCDVASIVGPIGDIPADGTYYIRVSNPVSGFQEVIKVDLARTGSGPFTLHWSDVANRGYGNTTAQTWLTGDFVEIVPMVESDIAIAAYVGLVDNDDDGKLVFDAFYSQNWGVVRPGSESEPSHVDPDPAVVSRAELQDYFSGGGGSLGWRGDVLAKSPLWIPAGCQMHTNGGHRKESDLTASLWEADAGFVGDWLFFNPPGHVAGDGACIHGGEWDANILNQTNNPNGHGVGLAGGNRFRWEHAGTYQNKQGTDPNASIGLLYGTYPDAPDSGAANFGLPNFVNNHAYNFMDLISPPGSGAIFAVVGPFANPTGAIKSAGAGVPTWGALAEGDTVVSGGITFMNVGDEPDSWGGDGFWDHGDCRATQGRAFYTNTGDLNMHGGHVHGCSSSTSPQIEEMAYFGGRNHKILGVHFEAGTNGHPQQQVTLDGNNTVFVGIIGHSNGTDTIPTHGLKLGVRFSGQVLVSLYPQGISGMSPSDAVYVPNAGREGTVIAYINDGDNRVYRRAFNLQADNDLVVSGVFKTQEFAPWLASAPPKDFGAVVHNGQKWRRTPLYTRLTDAADNNAGANQGSTQITMATVTLPPQSVQKGEVFRGVIGGIINPAVGPADADFITRCVIGGSTAGSVQADMAAVAADRMWRTLAEVTARDIVATATQINHAGHYTLGGAAQDMVVDDESTAKAAGGVAFIVSDDGIQTITYTGKDAPTHKLLGCTGGTGDVADNAVVTFYTVTFDVLLGAQNEAGNNTADKVGGDHASQGGLDWGSPIVLELKANWTTNAGGNIATGTTGYWTPVRS